MKETQMRKVLFSLTLGFALTLVVGCGRPSVRTIIEPKDISTYSQVYVADVAVSSHEETDAAKELNAKFSRLTKDVIIRTLGQKSRYTIQENLASSPEPLSIDTTIRITYGSRALRYMVGFGAGTGSMVANIYLKDASSGEVKLQMESNSALSVGTFGGSMDKVVMDNVRELVGQFMAAL